MLVTMNRIAYAKMLRPSKPPYVLSVAHRFERVNEVKPEFPILMIIDARVSKCDVES